MWKTIVIFHVSEIADDSMKYSMVSLYVRGYELGCRDSSPHEGNMSSLCAT
jgi:hypothetical protein